MKSYEAFFKKKDGTIKTINGIKANNIQEAIETALHIAKISVLPLQFKQCVECCNER